MVLHVAPESAVGGPLLAVDDGDEIVLDVAQRRVDLNVAATEIRRRLAERPLPDPPYRRGYGSIYLQHVMQADAGVDFDVLRHRVGEQQTEPAGLLEGWISGW